MRVRPEAVIAAEVPEDRVPFEPRALEVPAEHHRLQVVVDDLMRQPAQELKGLLMRAQEGRHLLVGRGPGVHLPAVAQGQDEEMDLRPFARDDRPALAPVGLALPARWRLEPYRRLDVRLFPQRAGEPPHDVVAAVIPLRSELLVDRLGAITDRRHPPPDSILEPR